MRTTIDSAGRLVIPREVRRQAGLRAGMQLEVRWRNGLVEIEPAADPVELERKGRFLVAMPRGEVELLTTDMVERVREAVRDERSPVG